MTGLVLKAYRFLSVHKALRIAMLALSSLLFVVLGLQLSYDEDISSLLPSTNNGNEKLAFWIWLWYENRKRRLKLFVERKGNFSKEPVWFYCLRCVVFYIENYFLVIKTYNHSWKVALFSFSQNGKFLEQCSILCFTWNFVKKDCAGFCGIL